MDDLVIDAMYEFLERDAYQREIATLLEKYPLDKRSLELNYCDIRDYDLELGTFTVDKPEKAQEHWQEALRQQTTGVDMDVSDVPIRVIEAEMYDVIPSELRSEHAGKYVRITGQAAKVSEVRPYIQMAAFECQSCSGITKVPCSFSVIKQPHKCDLCEAGDSQLLLNEEESEMVDHQIVDLSQPPEKGTDSETLEVVLKGDVCGQVQSGDRLRVNGVYKTKQKDLLTSNHPDARRETRLHGYAIESEQKSFEDMAAEVDDEIEAIAAQDREKILQDMQASLAPHLIGEAARRMRLPVILQQFSGVRYELADGTHVRGDVNVLLITEPGVGKSDILKSAKEIAPKGVMTGGKGATPAGMTATAEQDDRTGGWTLKAGALVLANGGLVCIDEFDKMKAETIDSMHEAMENQVVAVNKAGKNVELPTQCSVLAAANPKGGTYNRFEPLSEQINLDPPLISRFDAIIALKDDSDESQDQAIAEGQHAFAMAQDNGGGDEPEIPKETLRRYIAAARQLEPTYESQDVVDRLTDKYVELRQEAGDDDDISVTPRMNHALRRFAQASARMRLSDTITHWDAENALRVIKLKIGDHMLDEEGNVNEMQEYKASQDQQSKADAVKYTLRQESMTVNDVIAETGLSKSWVEDHIQKLLDRGDVYQPEGPGSELEWVE